MLVGDFMSAHHCLCLGFNGVDALLVVSASFLGASDSDGLLSARGTSVDAHLRLPPALPAPAAGAVPHSAAPPALRPGGGAAPLPSATSGGGAALRGWTQLPAARSAVPALQGIGAAATVRGGCATNGTPAGGAGGGGGPTRGGCCPARCCCCMARAQARWRASTSSAAAFCLFKSSAHALRRDASSRGCCCAPTAPTAATS